MAANPPASDADRGSLAGLLNEGRQRGFVGRDSTLRAFDDALAGASDARVLFLHGPGGIGKTTLLDALTRRAAGQARTSVYLDAREVVGTPTAVTAELTERSAHAGCPDGGAPDVLLIDGFERFEPLARWFRGTFLPSRPADSVTVVAGRDPPLAGWSADPGWHRLLLVQELTGLNRAESVDLLAGLGVPGPHRPALAALGRGHPLALTLLAEAYRSGHLPTDLAAEPDVVGRLCQLIIDDIPDAAHRAGLATCAHATRMTQDLLTYVIGPRADEVWAWLLSRPYVRRGSVGMFLHDVVREAFEADFAQRAPDAYTDLHRRIRTYFFRRVLDPQEAQPDRAASEILMLHRRSPLPDSTASLREVGILPVARAAAGEHAAILRLIEASEGSASAALARRWMLDQPRSVYRACSDDGVVAFGMHVYLPAGAGLAVDDPVAAAVLRAVGEHGPLRLGERININRFAGASGGDQRHPLVLLVNGVSCILEWAREPAAWTFIITIESDLYGPYFDYLGLRAMFSLDYFGHVLTGYGWDRRRFTTSAFFELMACRDLSGEAGPPPAELLRPAPLSQPAFATAVRDALHHLTRPDLLAGSPLLMTNLIDPAVPDAVHALQQALRASIRDLGTEPRGEPHRRVLERTYLKGAPSQEAAAGLLELPFSTYRRHLARAQERLIEVLWSVEIGVRLPAAAGRYGQELSTD